MNNLGMPRTQVDIREAQARGHELIRTGPDASTGIYGSGGRSRRPEQEALLGQARDIRRMILLGGPSPSANEAGSSGGSS